MAANIMRYIHDLLDAQICLACGRSLRPRSSRGSAVSPRLAQVQAYLCPTCMAALPYRDDGWQRIPGSNLYFCHVFDYVEPLRKLLLGLKFSGERQVAQALAPLAYIKLQSLGYRPEAVLPLPLSRRRYQERGYNQAEDLAQALADLLAVPCWTQLLQRKRATQPQTRMPDFRARERNVKGAFAVRRSADLASGPNLLLIDDVLTSGASCREAGRVLQQAGFPLRILVMARGLL